MAPSANEGFLIVCFPLPFHHQLSSPHQWNDLNNFPFLITFSRLTFAQATVKYPFDFVDTVPVE